MDFANDAITEAWEIVKTVDVHLDDNGVYRIEIVKRISRGPLVNFDARTYERKSLFRNSDGSISSESKLKGVEFYVWVPDYLLWINRDSADAAMSYILGELVQRRNNQNSVW